MVSPAQRYEIALVRALGRVHPVAVLEDFMDRQTFQLDPFQQEACQALAAGHNVLVAAPTGSGKTIVGEFAVNLALATGGRAFYTTPIKALSNQKFRDFGEIFGKDQVGLLTGDTVINGDAAVIVMTTEVLRNMLYESSGALSGLISVVMDEVHYLADRERGAVWEEVILHLPESVRIAALSATVSNAEEFGAWLDEVRGDTKIIVAEERPIPLDQLVMTEHELVDLFLPAESVQRVDQTALAVNPVLVRKATREASQQRSQWGEDRRGRRRRGRNAPTLRRTEMLEMLRRAELLPALVFIFSRAGCDAALQQCLRGGVRLTNADEARSIRELVDRKCAEVPEEDLAILGYHSWREALQRGVAAHHAGLLPLFKETVEELFTAGLVKAVFATETLALGINMPARSVVLERLIKWNGHTHADITPGEYTQLTGRAGRRGIDTFGFAVVVWHDGFDPRQLAGLAATRTYPLRSSFRPAYNMTVNLVQRLGTSASRELLETSFAQFQADQRVVGLAAKLRKQEQALVGYSDAMACHLGDFGEYFRLRSELTELERDRRRRESGPMREERIAGLTRQLRRHPCQGCADRQQHERWAQRHQRLAATTQRLRNQMRERTGNIAKQFDRVCQLLVERGYLELVEAELERGESNHPEAVAPVADRDAIGAGLAAGSGIGSGSGIGIESGNDHRVSAAGQMLSALHTDQDLLTCEVLRSGLWEGLRSAELAALLSALVFESRSSDDDSLTYQPVPAHRALSRALIELRELAEDLAEHEMRYQLDFVRLPDPGLVRATLRWASGKPLHQVLNEDLTAGDFVRSIRQLIDLLSQVAVAGAELPDGARLAAAAKVAIGSLRRGVVEYSSIEG